MILVTGATGTNGREAVQELSAQGIPVRALVHSPAKAASIAGPGVEIAEGSFDNVPALEKALDGIDHVFLVTPGVPQSVEMTHRFIDLAKTAGVKHIVKLSALGSSPESPIRFGRWHAASEEYLRNSGIDWTFLHPNSFMQNLFMSAPTIIGQGAIYQPAADAKISHIDVRDIAAVAVKALTEPGHVGKVYDLTGPEALSFEAVAEKLSAVLGKPVQYVAVTPEQFKQSVLGIGMPEWLADALNELNAIYRDGMGAVVTSTTQEVTGKPARTLDQFLRDFAPAFQAKPGA